MKNIICTLALTLSSFILLQAQELEKSLLWEISGNGLTESSYIYGTIHMTCDATLSEGITKALDETSLLVLELDMDDPKMQMSMMKGMYMKDGKTIKDLVSEEDYLTISKLVKDQMGIPLDAMGNIKPFFISAMFYPKLLDCPVQSYEEALMKVAHEQQEEVLGLETVEEQMSVFDEIPYEDQAIDLLRSAKNNLADDTASFKELMALYNDKNIEGMITMMETDKNLSTSKHSDKILYNRNKNWINKITDHAKKQPTFFGVGAAHLAGNNGVIKLLRKAGYTVQASH
ncbi:TraB/GumN family protein [Psychroserpens damuponensis]|uniref:TraB/GumN family protein n=1 Tax=Psychroserpens damuponensis TaxID=943936 RepID=UPI000590D1BA|nr:TraB/GumN family protein [Psychroserpens damuponensis]